MEKEIKSVLFLGIGGVSMHQLALAYKQLGVTVYGYDVKESVYTQKCKDCGILITKKFKPDFTQVDLCVKTGAIKENNKYIKLLKQKQIKIVDRAEVLSKFCSNFKHVIAVAGTHGKSTTAALIYEMFRTANKKVSCHIGADIENVRFDLSDDFLIVEACEYNKSFLSLHPTTAVVTNVEAEHMDSYGSVFALKNSFLTFLKRAKNRFVYLDKTTKFLKRNKKINFVGNTNLDINPKLKGEHNFKNISLAIAVAKHFDIGDKTIIIAVNNFKGISRRYEFLGIKNQSKIYIDYAHHPTEVDAFIKTFKEEYSDCNIVFQPHTYSRTKLLLPQFIEVLKDVENLIIFKEYPARENKSAGMSAKDLCNELKKINNSVKYCATYASLVRNIKQNQATAFVGAGDINKLAQKFVKSN